MRKIIYLLIFIFITSSAYGSWLFNPHTSKLDYYGMPAYTVATLPSSPSDGETAVVTDGDDGADCTTGGGTSLNICIYDEGGAAWVIAGDGAGSGNAFTTHDTPAGTDPVASGADTLTWDDTAPITITGNSTTDTITVAITDATTSSKGAASFSSSHFSVSSGAVSVVADGIDDTLIDWGTGANQVSPADMANEDIGDISISSGSWTLDEDTVDVTALKDDAAPTDEDILTYEATGTTISYMSIDEVAGAISEGALTNDSVVEADLKFVDTAADEAIMTYESTTGDFEWHTFDEVVVNMSEGLLPNDSVVEADLKFVDSAADEAVMTYESTTGDFEWHTIDELVATISAGALTDASVQENDLAAALAFDEGDLIDLSGITMSASTDEGIALPTYADVTPTTEKYYAAYDAANNRIMVRESGGWVDTSAGSGAATTLNFVVTSAEGSLTSESVLTAGNLIDITDAGGDGGAVTVAVDLTEADDITWDGGDSSTWTFNAGAGTDPTFVYGNQTLALSAATSITHTTPLHIQGQATDPIYRFDETDGTDWELRVDDTGNQFEIGSSAGGVGDNVELAIDEDGDVHITGDVYVTGDDIFMTTNTDKYILVANGTNFNPVESTGDVIISNDGSSEIQANSVALGTDTTNNYVATIADAGNSNITVANSGSESAAVTLDVVDLTCTDCINATEIEDIYVLIAGDTMAGNLNLDDGSGDSPTITLTDGDASNYTLVLQKLDTGAATITNNEGAINILPSGDTGDYLTISTASDIITIGTVGGTDGDLVIAAAGGEISFGDENLSGTGTLGIGETTLTGDLNLLSSDADAGATAGALKHDSTIANMTEGGLRWYSGVTQQQRLIVDLDTDPTGAGQDDYVVAYDQPNGEFYLKQDADSGGATAWHNIGAPTQADEIDMGAYFIELNVTDFAIGDGVDSKANAVVFTGGSGGEFQLGSAGVNFQGDNDGAFTMTGLGAGYDEDLTLNFDDTENEIVVSSSTGVTNIDFGAITLEAGGLTLDASAAPTVTFNDSDAAGAAAADEEAVKILANMSTTTEDAEVSDVAMTFMDAGTRESFLRFDGSAWQLFLGPQTDGWSGGDVTGYEQLTFDFDTANDGEIAITSTSSSTLNNQLDTYFGVDDNEPGVVAVYGGGTGEEGGELYLYTGADDDTSIANYSALVVEDDLLIGSDGDTDMLKFIAETSIQSTVAFDVDGAFTAGTLDADTDFTVDGLVISADSIENDATLNFKTSAAAGNAVTIALGESDSNHGILNMMADDDTAGPTIDFQIPPNNDTTITDFIIQVNDNSDDLYIGTNADEDVMKFIDDTSVQFTVALDVDAAFTASTVASDGDVSGTTLSPSDDVTIADTKSIKSGASASDYFSIETTDDVGGTPAQVEAMRVTVAGTSDAPLVEVGDSGTTSPGVVTYIQIAADAMANERHSGIVLTGRNAGEAIDQGNPVLWDNTDNEWVEADADASTCGDGDDPCWPAQGIALSTGSDGNPLDVLVQGYIRHDDWAFTVTSGTARTLYLSDNPADNSGVTQTAPSTSGDCVQLIGWAISDDEAYVNFSGHYLEVE